MAEPGGLVVKSHQRVSTLLLAILTGIATVVVFGLALIGLRLMAIQAELDRLGAESLPRMVKLAQLSQDASATSSIAPALSMNPTRSEFDTLLARIRDKERSQRALIAELDGLFSEPGRIEALQHSADLLIRNLEGLTDAVDNQIAVGLRLEAYGESFEQLLRAVRDSEDPAAPGAAALAMQAVSEIGGLLLDTNRARFARNRRAAEAAADTLAQSLIEQPADGLADGVGAAARAIVDLWNESRQAVLEEKAAQLSHAFQIKALAEENSLIANRLLSSASNEFWRAGSQLDAKVRLVNQTARFTLFAIVGVVLLLGAGIFLSGRCSRGACSNGWIVCAALWRSMPKIGSMVFLTNALTRSVKFPRRWRITWL